jgi:predicted aspartyl protease
MVYAVSGFRLSATALAALVSMLIPSQALASQPAADHRPADPLAAVAETPLLIETMREDRYNRLTLPVRVGGQGPFGFIVDTGAERTVVSRELAARLGLANAGQARVVGIAEATMADLFRMESVQLNHLELGNMVVPAFGQAAIGGPGLIGINSLENHRLVIDFTIRQIDILQSERTRRRERQPEFDSDAIVVTARREAGRMILSNATYNGRRVDLVIDTGGQSSVGNRALRRLVQAGRGGNRLTDGQLTSVTGAQLAVEMGSIDAISIAGIDLNNVRVAYADSPVFAVLGLEQRPALLLGMDTLQMFDRIGVDFANRRVTFDLPGNGRSRANRPPLDLRADIPIR